MAGRTEEILARKGEIMKRALGMDYSQFERSPIAYPDFGELSRAAVHLFLASQDKSLTRLMQKMSSECEK